MFFDESDTPLSPELSDTGCCSVSKTASDDVILYCDTVSLAAELTLSVIETVDAADEVLPLLPLQAANAQATSNEHIIHKNLYFN